MDLEDYRRSSETFVSELTAEYYRHYAGLKDSYEIESIYARHAELFTTARAMLVDGLRDRQTLLLDLEGDDLTDTTNDAVRA